MIQERNVKPYLIPRHLIMSAWEKVRINRGIIPGMRKLDSG